MTDKIDRQKLREELNKLSENVGSIDVTDFDRGAIETCNYILKKLDAGDFDEKKS